MQKKYGIQSDLGANQSYKVRSSRVTHSILLAGSLAGTAVGRKKIAAGGRAINSSGTAGGDLPYGGCSGLAFFEFLKFVVPGTFFAKDFGVAVDLRAVGFSRIRIKDDIIALQLEFTGFVSIIRVFDEKIQAAAYGTLHCFTPHLRKTKIRKTKSEIRNKYKIRISKFSTHIY
jgi:hypothetical protein